MNPFIGGGSNNLYRCFIDLAFRLTSRSGFSALIHQDGHLNDPKAGRFRKHWYRRITKHFHFRNEIKKKMFSEVHNNTEFSLNVYRGFASEVNFDQFTSAFLPSQVEDSYQTDAPVSTGIRIKDFHGNWETSGNSERVIKICEPELKTIEKLTEGDYVQNELSPRFIQPFAKSTLNVFEKLAVAKKLGDIHDINRAWQMAPHWNETAAQNDGTIERVTKFRAIEEMVIQGPLFYVGNPIYKTAKRISKTNKAFDPIDLTKIPADYVPRTNYGPAIPLADYQRRITKSSWDESKTHADFFRLALRAMVAINGERALVSAIIPPGMLHINGVESIAFRKFEHLLSFSSFCFSLVGDFYIKAGSVDNLHHSILDRFPFIHARKAANLRVVRLSCVTEAYARLEEKFVVQLKDELTADEIREIYDSPFEAIREKDFILRDEYSRRLALIEIDVITALTLGLSSDQLFDIYRIYFQCYKRMRRALGMTEMVW